MKKSSADKPGIDLPPRHRWVAEFLARAESSMQAAGEGVFDCELGGELAEFLNRPRLRITFLRKSAMAGEADLAVPGSWLHDQFLRFARERGRVAKAFLEPRPDLDREQVVASRRRNGVQLGERVESRYGSLLVFTFRVFYYSDPAEEDILHIGFDAERGRVVRRSLSRMVSEAVAESARNGFGPAPKPDVSTAFGAVWTVLENEVEERVRVMEEAGRPAYLARIRTVETYYRQLLSEEKRLLESRASRKGHDESKGRIELLKVEWERRMTEEADRLRPQVVARLCAVATLHLPLERWTATRDHGSGGESHVWIDLARGEAWEEAGGNHCDPSGGRG